jgi:hypothetical protein
MSLLLCGTLDLLIEVLLNVFDHFFVLFVKLGDEHLVIGFTAIL